MNNIPTQNSMNTSNNTIPVNDITANASYNSISPLNGPAPSNNCPGVWEWFFKFYSLGVNQKQMLPANLATPEAKNVLATYVKKRSQRAPQKKFQFANTSKFEMEMSIESGVFKRHHILDNKTAKLYKFAKDNVLPNPKTADEKAVANYAVKMLSCTIKKRLIDRLERDVKKDGKDLVVGTGELMHFDFYFQKKQQAKRKIQVSKRKSGFEVNVVYTFDAKSPFMKEVRKSEFEKEFTGPFQYKMKEIILGYESLEIKMNVGSGIIYCRWVQNEEVKDVVENEKK